MTEAVSPGLITKRPSQKRRRVVYALLALLVVVGIVGLVRHFASYQSVSERAQAAQVQLESQISHSRDLLAQCEQLAAEYRGTTVCANAVALQKQIRVSEQYLAGIDQQAYKNTERAAALHEELDDHIALLQDECDKTDEALAQFDSVLGQYTVDRWRLWRLERNLGYRVLAAQGIVETAQIRIPYAPELGELVAAIERAERMLADREESPFPFVYSAKNSAQLARTIKDVKAVMELLQAKSQEVADIEAALANPVSPVQPPDPEQPDIDNGPAEENPPANRAPQPNPPAPQPPAPNPPAPQPPAPNPPAPQPPAPNPPAPQPDPPSPSPQPPTPPPNPDPPSPPTTPPAPDPPSPDPDPGT